MKRDNYVHVFITKMVNKLSNLDYSTYSLPFVTIWINRFNTLTEKDKYRLIDTLTKCQSEFIIKNMNEGKDIRVHGLGHFAMSRPKRLLYESNIPLIPKGEKKAYSKSLELSYGIMDKYHDLILKRFNRKKIVHVSRKELKLFCEENNLKHVDK